MNIPKQKRTVNIMIRVSPAEADLIEKCQSLANQTKVDCIVNGVNAYFESLRAADQKQTTNPPQTQTPADKIAEAVAAVEGRQPTTSPAGATETPPEAQQDSQPDYISNAGEDPQRAAQNATERAGEDQPGQVRIYTEAELKQAIQEAATQAAQKAARQARQEIKREMRAQAIQAAGMTIGSARRAKASAVSTVNGLKPLRIKRPKK